METRIPPEVRRRNRSFYFVMNVREDRLLRTAAAAARVPIARFIRESIARAALDPDFHRGIAKPR